MGLHDNMRTEVVTRLRIRKPVTVSPETPLRDVVQKMRAGRLGCAIAIDGDGKPLGMFTESMLTQLLEQVPAVLDEPIQSHLTEHWPWVKETDPIEDVLEAMHLKNVRFICVVDDSGKLVGLTGQKGMMEYVADHFPEQVMVQRVGCAPFMHKREGA